MAHSACFPIPQGDHLLEGWSPFHNLSYHCGGPAEENLSCGEDHGNINVQGTQVSALENVCKIIHTVCTLL